MAEAVVRAVGLEKRYGLRTVLRDVSFELQRGEVLAEMVEQERAGNRQYGR